MAELNKFLGNVVVQVVNPLILLLAAAAFVLFVWGVFEFIRNSGDETKRVEGRHAILWGLVGLVIIFGAYDIINVAVTTFNIKDSNNAPLKLVPGALSKPAP